jgi:protein TonB
MMRLWVQSYEKRTSVAPVLTLSAGVHVGIIGLWVLATMPAANVPPDSIANRVYYIPPPDKVPGGQRHEVVHYVSVGTGALLEGAGPRTMGDARPVTANEAVGRGLPDTAVAAPPPPPASTSEDSVFTVLDVDTAVVRSSSSAAPAYPLKLLQDHVTGVVSARYVVDTSGFADTTTFEVLSATRREFADAVRAALPNMRFSPAKIGSLKVRQLVEQQFSFKINDTGTVAPRTVKRP